MTLLIDYCPLLYILSGLIILLILIRISHADAQQDLSENLGRVVTMALLAWPYVLLVWIFSLKFWLDPVGRRK